MAAISLSQGKVAIVSQRDFKYLSQWKWYFGGRGYAIRHTKMINGKREKIYMHRVILDAPTEKQIDHIDGNRINNTRENIRICTQLENLHNQKRAKNNTSGYKGVHFLKKDKKWIVSIGFNGKNYCLGRFLDIKEAARAYDKKAKELYGEFARLNYA